MRRICRKEALYALSSIAAGIAFGAIVYVLTSKQSSESDSDSDKK
uniref:Uncharacterized protein n=1 Tax=viral metagenome TaxID=1070528 RepID=A0A6C0H3K5_9ZZZZ